MVKSSAWAWCFWPCDWVKIWRHRLWIVNIISVDWAIFLWARDCFRAGGSSFVCAFWCRKHPVILRSKIILTADRSKTLDQLKFVQNLLNNRIFTLYLPHQLGIAKSLKHEHLEPMNLNLRLTKSIFYCKSLLKSFNKNSPTTKNHPKSISNPVFLSLSSDFILFRPVSFCYFGVSPAILRGQQHTNGSFNGGPWRSSAPRGWKV